MIAPSLFAIFRVASVVSIKNSRFLLRSFYVGVLSLLGLFFREVLLLRPELRCGFARFGFPRCLT